VEVKQASQRIPELDGLRGLAILLVLLDHYLSTPRIVGFSRYWSLFFKSLGGGQVGVDLFFVLSGFLIGGILLESRESPNYFRTFYLRRIHRILPVYYSFILIYLVALGISHICWPGVSIVPADFSHLPRYVFFLQNFFWSKTRLEWLFLGVTWSLAIEEQFYLCAPLVIRYVPARRLRAALIAVLLLAPLLRFALFLGPEAYRFWATLSMPCRADSLALGILGALAWRSERFHVFLHENPKLPARVLLFFSLAVGALLPWTYRPRGPFMGSVGYSTLALFFLALLLFVLVRRESWLAGFMRISPLGRLGTISYCVYIIHAPILHITHYLLLRSSPAIDSFPGAFATFLATLATLGVAALSWHFMEKPLIKRGHRFVYSSSPRPQS
jgi:peptidoglycan/LPS O-acetylase OafA/YrhL